MMLLLLTSITTQASEEHSLTKKDVFELQEQLSHAGYAVKYFDGLLGRETQIAIKSYAKHHDIENEPEVVLGHIRRNQTSYIGKIESLKDEIKTLQSDIKAVQKKIDTDVEKPFFTPSRDIPSLIKSESKQSDVEIYKNIAFGLLLSILAGVVGIYFMFEKIKKELKEQIEKDLNNSLSDSMTDKITEAKTEVDRHVKKLSKKALREHHEDYGELTGRISFFLYGVKNTLATFKETIPAEDPIVDSLDNISGTIQKTHEVSNFAAMQTILKLPMSQIKSNDELLTSVTNGLYYLADDIANDSMVLRTETKAKKLIKRTINLFEKYVVEEMPKDEMWMDAMDNLCYSASVTCEFNDEKLKAYLTMMENYIQSDNKSNFESVEELLSVYPERVKQLMAN
ncbi:peptidoglycan-binding protein [Aliiglaciecola sp. M165]|uniref:peptidoglycan-binding domain-containing protein n=1 Tax=Aliiglaciecola sp. M165 TaxID=2593649 RepID=UPI00117D08D9|nr:peptidoglycan-binding domain-containing protein [Aliiglaciecola sp. M165]TRY33890.1 hypothetical protein FM019_01120 [Aliiglaciecola sp. M165]